MTSKIANSPKVVPRSTEGLWQFARSGIRILAALILVVFGAFVGVSGCSLLWAALSRFMIPPGTVGLHDYHWIQIGNINLTGWQIYAFAASLLLVALASIALAVSWLVKRTEDDKRE